MNRTERLLDLIALLVNARRPVPFDEIRAAFPEDYGEGTIEAARRKFERDKRELLELGIPLEYVPPDADDLDAGEDEGGYVVDRRRAFLPPLSLDPEDMAFLYLVALAATSDASFPYRDEMLLALRKIELAGGNGQTALAGQAAPLRLYIDRTALGDADKSALSARVRQVEDALRRRKCVTLRYAGGGDSESEHQVEPYGLFWRGGRWTLVGLSRQRRALRRFSLHRVRALEVESARPGSPDFDVPATFQLADYLKTPAWQEEVEPPLVIELEVAADYAWLAEREFAGKAGGDGAWRRLAVETTCSDAVVGWVLGLGPHVRVVGPAPVRKRVIDALAQLAEASGS